MSGITNGGDTVVPGERRTIDLPVAPMYSHDELSNSIVAKHAELFQEEFLPKEAVDVTRALSGAPIT